MTEQTPDAPGKIEPCLDVSPSSPNMRCSLDLGHAGPHQNVYLREWWGPIYKAPALITDAPGGERAKDEPRECGSVRPGMLGETCNLPSGHSGMHRRLTPNMGTVEAWLPGVTASPRPAEPEPPKAEQEPGGTLRGILKAEIQQQLAYAAKTKPSAGMTTPGEHRHTAGVLRSILTLDDFLRGQASIGRSCGLPVGGDALPCVYPPGHAGRCRDKVMPGPGVEPKRESTGGPLNHAAGSHFVVQPKADTGTLIADLKRAHSAIWLTADEPVAREVSTLFRRAILALEARASSPDLRALVEHNDEAQ